jgi:uncharacterized protein (UPF0332 family)
VKDACFEDCLHSGNAQRREPDPGKARSLRATAEARIHFATRNSTKQELNFVFEALYTSLLELIHAHLLEKGYVVENHACVGYYVRDILRDESFFAQFDTCRYRRNGLVYYGKLLPEAVAEESVALTTKLITNARNLPAH